jgi:radical SAM-linked protein
MKPREFGQGRAARYRMRFEKLGPMALEGHIDLVRSVPRIFRRAGIQMFYTEGFTPRPLISFGPALGLGARSIAEYADIGILADLDAHELMALANQFAPAGFRVTGMRRLADREKPLSNLVDGVETIVTFTSSAIATLVGDGGTPEAAIDELRKRIDELAENRALMVEVRRKDKGAPRPFWDVALDIAPFVTDDLGDLAIGDGRVALRIQQHLGRGASMKPQEIAAVVAPELTPRDIVRTGCWAIRDGSFVDPLDIVELGGKSGLEPRDDVDGAELVAESPAE